MIKTFNKKLCFKHCRVYHVAKIHRVIGSWRAAILMGSQNECGNHVLRLFSTWHTLTKWSMFMVTKFKPVPYVSSPYLKEWDFKTFGNMTHPIKGGGRGVCDLLNRYVALMCSSIVFPIHGRRTGQTQMKWSLVFFLVSFWLKPETQKDCLSQFLLIKFPIKLKTQIR